MGKYYPLERHLSKLSTKSTMMTFNQVERVLGDVLPEAASKYRQWWANDRTHVHARAWLSAGWEVQAVDWSRSIVTFVT
jgi:hypothetical protein